MQCVKLRRYSKVNKIECACCGEDIVEFLSLDHIKNNGAKERREFNCNGGYAFYLKLRKLGYPEGYQVLCHNCNIAKGAFGECPHITKSRYKNE